MKTARPYWAIPLTMLATIVAAAGGTTLPTMLLAERSEVLAFVASSLAVTLIALLLVFVWRRFLLRRPWSGVGLRPSRSALPQALLGAGIAAAAVLLTNAVSVAVGAATWVPWSESGQPLGVIVLYVLSVSILLQGFPEELLWRGHLYDVLSGSMAPRAVLLLTSVSFGSLHIVSSSGAEGIGERLLWIVMAVALGFACGVARARTGAVWMAAGVHSGLHIGLRGVPAEPSNFALWVVLLTVAMTLTGLLVLGRPTRTPPTTQPAPPAPSSHQDP